MPFERESNRIIIAGASSLLGAELKSLLEQSRFAASEFSLLDEELAAGTLTEAGGEPAVIRPVEEDSFNRARFVFFTGSSEFTRANLALAKRSGAAIPYRYLTLLRGFPVSKSFAARSLLKSHVSRRSYRPRPKRLFVLPSHSEIWVFAV